MKTFSFLLLLLLVTDASPCRTALEIINQIRESEFAAEHFGIGFLEYERYQPTLNPFVDHVVRERCVAFFQNLRKFDHQLNIYRLVEYSRGALLPIHQAPFTLPREGLDERWEAALLWPLFVRNKKCFVKCLKEDGGSLLGCLERGLERELDGLHLERSLTAVHFLRISLDILASSSFIINDRQLARLRNDDMSLKALTDWDRLSTVPKALYLHFTFHARKLIASLSNNLNEYKAVSTLHAALHHALFIEMPVQTYVEVLRERVKQVNSQAVTLYLGSIKETVSVEDVCVLLVKQRLRIEIMPRIFWKDRVLYVSVPEFYGEGDPLALESLLRRVIARLNLNDLILESNPSTFEDLN